MVAMSMRSGLLVLVGLVGLGSYRYSLADGGVGGNAACIAVNELKGMPAALAVGTGSGAASRETVLVTGGLGFIGSHVVEELLARSFTVVVYDDESNGHNHNMGALNVHGDVTVIHDFRQLLTLPVKIDYLIHLAAAISVAESMTMPEKYKRINEEGSKKVMLWALAHGVKHVVAASSAAVYGVPPASAMPLKETEPYRGISPYAKSKYAMEDTMRDLSKHYGLCATALRFFNVYGPRQDPKSAYSGVISLFMDKANQGEVVGVLGDGAQTRDFVYVKDIARAIITAMKSEQCAMDVFNVCTGTHITVQQLATTVVRLFGGKSPIKNLPPRDGDIRISECDPSKLNKVLGYTANVDIETGLGFTRDWFKLPKERQGDLQSSPFKP